MDARPPQRGSTRGLPSSWPPPAPETVPPPPAKGRGRRAAAFAIVGVLLANVLVAAGLLASGVLPWQFATAAAKETGQPPLEISAAASPAASTVTATMATEVPGFTGAAASNLGAGVAAAYPCEISAPAQSVLGQYRTYSAGATSVTATTSVYPTGSGPWVMETMAAQLADCADRRGEVNRAGNVEELGVRAVTAELPSGTLYLARRGDVILRVSGPREQAEAVVTALDATLASNLTACADPVGSVGDERRNPWLADVPYQGLLADLAVTVDPLGPPAPPMGVTAVALDTPAPDLPTVVVPDRPADPVWPAELPAPVIKPTAPTSPGVEPVSTVIKVPEIDTVGPVCGWGYTLTAAPDVNPAEIAERKSTLALAARSNLLARQQAWRPAVLTFYQDWATYQTAVNAYQRYASSVSAVAVAWSVISEQRKAYRAALAAYERAIVARDEFLAEQTAARTAYDAEVAACLIPVPTPTAPTPSTSPGATPEATPTPTPTPTPVRICPPIRPAILDQLPPTVPLQPTPPPDPRPVDAR